MPTPKLRMLGIIASLGSVGGNSLSFRNVKFAGILTMQNTGSRSWHVPLKVMPCSNVHVGSCAMNARQASKALN